MALQELKEKLHKKKAEEIQHIKYALKFLNSEYNRKVDLANEMLKENPLQVIISKPLTKEQRMKVRGEYLDELDTIFNLAATLKDRRDLLRGEADKLLVDWHDISEFMEMIKKVKNTEKKQVYENELNSLLKPYLNDGWGDDVEQLKSGYV